MTYPDGDNLHGIMYLPWNGAEPPKAKRSLEELFPPVTSRPETEVRAGRKTGYYHRSPWPKNHL